ncbi:hypothetical protein EV177_010566, partial [Coemansia sp. RSA 1804]
MNSEFGTPSRSQQHSPAPMPNQQLAASSMHLPAAMTLQYPLSMSTMDVVTPTSAIEIGGGHFAHLKDAFHQRPFSPSAMDFANMNIASGYPTPLSATPVSMHYPQQQQQQQFTPMDVLSAPVTDVAPSVETGAPSSDTGESSVNTSASGKSKTPNPDKPEYSYASLIAQSLMKAPLQRRTLNGIY